MMASLSGGLATMGPEQSKALLSALWHRDPEALEMVKPSARQWWPPCSSPGAVNPAIRGENGSRASVLGLQVFGAVLELQTMVMARMPSTTPSDTATGIL